MPKFTCIHGGEGDIEYVECFATDIDCHSLFSELLLSANAAIPSVSSKKIDDTTPMVLQIWGGKGGKTKYPGSVSAKGGLARMDTTIGALKNLDNIALGSGIYDGLVYLMGGNGLDGGTGQGISVETSPPAAGAQGGAASVVALIPGKDQEKALIILAAGGAGGASIQWPKGGAGGNAFVVEGKKNYYVAGENGGGSGYGGGGYDGKGSKRFNSGGDGWFGDGGLKYEWRESDTGYVQLSTPGWSNYDPAYLAFLKKFGTGHGGGQDKIDNDFSAYSGGGSGGGGCGGGSCGGSQESAEGGGGGGGSYAHVSTIKKETFITFPKNNPNPDSGGTFLITFFL